MLYDVVKLRQIILGILFRTGFLFPVLQCVLGQEKDDHLHSDFFSHAGLAAWKYSVNIVKSVDCSQSECETRGM